MNTVEQKQKQHTTTPADEVIDEMPAPVITDVLDDELVAEIDGILDGAGDLADDVLLNSARAEKVQRVKAHGSSRSQDGVVATRAWSMGGRVD